MRSKKSLTRTLPSSRCSRNSASRFGVKIRRAPGLDFFELLRRPVTITDRYFSVCCRPTDSSCIPALSKSGYSSKNSSTFPPVFFLPSSLAGKTLVSLTTSRSPGLKKSIMSVNFISCMSLLRQSRTRRRDCSRFSVGTWAIRRGSSSYSYDLRLKSGFIYFSYAAAFSKIGCRDAENTLTFQIVPYITCFKKGCGCY